MSDINKNLKELSRRRELEQQVLKEIENSEIHANLIEIKTQKNTTKIMFFSEAINRWKEMLK